MTCHLPPLTALLQNPSFTPTIFLFYHYAVFLGIHALPKMINQWVKSRRVILPQQNSRLMLIILKMENIFDYYWRKRYAFNPFPTPLPYDLLRTISINVALYTPLRLRNLRLSPDVHFSRIRFGLLASNVTPIVKKDFFAICMSLQYHHQMLILHQLMVVFKNTVSGQHVVIGRYEYYFLPLFLKPLSTLKLRYWVRCILRPVAKVFF